MINLIIFIISLLLIKIKGTPIFIIINYINLLFILPINLINKLYIILITYLAINILAMIKIKKGNDFFMYFGVPGSGKTTIAAYLVKKYEKKYKKNNKKIWSNVNIKGTYKFTKSDIGIYNIENGCMIYDEVAFDFDNRNFNSNFTKAQLKWFKLHRHYDVDIHMFSQAYDDADKKLRNLTTAYYAVNKSIIPFLIYFKKMKPKFGISKVDEQPNYVYKWCIFSSYYVFMPSVWKMFNSQEKEQLFTKKWEKREMTQKTQKTL